MAPTSSNPGPYSLPDRNEVQLSAEDDWTRVKGSRMKARLEELQLQLQTYEEQKSKGEVEGRVPSPSSPPSSPAAACLHLHPTPPSEHNSCKTNTKPSPINPASLSTPNNVVVAMDPNQYAQAINQLSHDIDLIGNDDSQWFVDSTSLLQGTEASSCIQPSIPTPPKSIDQSFLLPAYMPEGSTNPNTGPANLSQSILQDFHRFHIQLLAKINNPPEAVAVTHSDNVPTAKSPFALGQSQWSLCATDPTPAVQNVVPNADPTTDSFSGPLSDFDNLENMMDLTTSTSDLPNATWTPSQQFFGLETAPRSHHADDSMQQQSSISNETQPVTSKSAKFDRYNAFVTKSPAKTSTPETEELLEAAIAGLETLGFTSVDSFAETYYNSNFDESSLLAGEQSMSRKRRLPRMLSQVLDSAQSWDPWDRRGLNEEVFRTAESLLVAERKNLDERSLEASINSIMQAAQHPGNATPPEQNATEIKKVLQNELPNLWPMMMALTSGNRAFRQRDRSNLVLAAIIILNCSSNISKQRLMEFLDICL
ncbi:transcriptional regulator [Fusarium avenaceum]|nr:transcriptional regulator [Fusarium avenaceum]